MTRREQWISFYTAALAGTADPRINPGEEVADRSESAAWAARQAETVADEAMARLDARDFPEPKVQALMLTARNVWKAAEHKGEKATVPAHLLATLGEALKAFDEGAS